MSIFSGEPVQFGSIAARPRADESPFDKVAGAATLSPGLARDLAGGGVPNAVAGALAEPEFRRQVADGWEAGRRVINTNKVELLEEEETRRRLADIEKATGVKLPDPFGGAPMDEVDEDAIRRQYTQGGMRGGPTGLAIRDARIKAFEGRVEALRTRFPDAQIESREEMRAKMGARAQALEVQLKDAGVPGFIGAFGAAFTDPVNLATLPFGGGGKSVLGVALKEAGINIGVEAAITPFDQEQRRTLGLETGARQAATNIALAGAFGFAGGGAIRLGEKAFGRMSRSEALAAVDKLPEEAMTPEIVAARNALEQELVVDEAAGLDRQPDAAISEEHHAVLNEIGDLDQNVSRETFSSGENRIEAPGIARETTPELRSDYAAFRPDELIVDAKTFQFKTSGDAEGVTDALKGVKKWDPIKAGEVLVWEDAAGNRFVADGHQRSALARKLAEAGQDITLRGVLLREADGVTAGDARAIAAAKNIAQGTGSAVDAAKVLKVRPELLDGSLNARSALVRDAEGLMRLGDDAFGMVINEVVPDSYGALVGRLVADAREQLSVMGLLARQSPASAAEAEALIRQATAAGFKREVQEGLFGPEEAAESMLGYRASVLGRAVSQLRRDKRIFSTLDREAGEIEAAGNQLNQERNREIARNANEIAETVLRTAHLAGPVADALNRAARHVAGGGQLAKAVRDFVGELRDLGPETLRGLDPARRGFGGARGAVEGAGEGGRAEAQASGLGGADLFDDPGAGAATGRGVEAQTAALEDDLFGKAVEPTPEPKKDGAGGASQTETPQETGPPLDPNERFLIGEELDENGEIVPKYQTRAEMEAEFQADEDMIARLEGCLKR